MGRAPDLCGLSQGSLGNSGGGPQKRVHVAEGKGQAKKGRGVGLVYPGGYGEVTGSPAPRPSALTLGPLVAKVTCPRTDTRQRL